MTYTPSSSMRSAMRVARSAPSSPGNMTGTIAWSPGSRVKPAWVISVRNSSALRASSWRAPSAWRAIRTARRLPPTTDGATVLENR